MDATGFLVGLLFAGIGFYVLYWIVRVAVRGGMRDHVEWLESRSPDDPGSASEG